MLKNLRPRVADALWPALIGAALSLGLILPVLHAFSVQGADSAALWCVATAAVCAAAGLGGKTRWIAFCLGGIALAAALLPNGGLSRYLALFQAIVNAAMGGTESILSYGQQIALLSGVLLTLAGVSMAKQSAGFYPGLSLTMVTVLVVWFSGKAESIWLFTPALCALGALFARSSDPQTPAGSTVAASILAVLIAVCVTPLMHFRSPALEGFAERVRTFIADTLFFTEPRRVYSIQVDGYKPLDDQLGGPAEVTSRPVMTVETPRTVLLRGVVFNDYNGLSWNDTLASRRYLFADPRYAGTRAGLFDEKRPEDAIRQSPMFDTFPVKITMQVDSASTLFVPLRTKSLNMPMDLVPYFSASSEVFVTRDLKAGDSYALTCAAVSPDDPALPALLERAAQTERRDLPNYLNVPDAVAPDVREIAKRLSEGADSPLEIAKTIRNYLLTNYSYTLIPSMPPKNQDFVSHFLLIGKKGYCTYFASSMAILCRLAGLPTRYVEGYLAEPSGGVALVTSMQAHAWAEVYFDGFGWIAFDATPGQGPGGDGQNNNQPQDTPDAPDEQDEQDDQPQGGEPSPEPTGQPDGPGNEAEPSPSPNPSDAPDQQDEPQTDNPSDGDEPDGRGGGNAWWVILLLIALSAAGALREWITRPDTVVRRAAKTDGDRLLVWYRALLGLLTARGLPPKPSESPIQFAARVGGTLPESCGFTGIADAVTLLGYGRFGSNPAQTDDARACYRAVWQSSSWRVRLKWFGRRMVKGVGSIRQVP